jgi:hypothetical protein
LARADDVAAAAGVDDDIVNSDNRAPAIDRRPSLQSGLSLRGRHSTAIPAKASAGMHFVMSRLVRRA